MKILVLNCGSSSIKYALYNMTDQSVITSGGIEKIGLPDSCIIVKLNGEKHKMERPIEEHTAGVQWIFEVLTTGDYAVLNSLEELDAVGHRMVHGGEKFNKSVVLTPEVMEAFTACNDLAPLHNPANIKGVNAVSALLPNITQVGVFDTAFHQTMPDYAYMYALPYELYEKYGVRRYGFHGTSHRYVSQRVCEFLGCSPEGKKIITCHIGNGASIAAVKDGSMSFKDQRSFARARRNGCEPKGVEPLVHMLKNSDSQELKLIAAEALGWYLYSSAKEEILAQCNNLYNAEKDELVKAELLKTINRLK